jgi:hypothetical protein
MRELSKAVKPLNQASLTINSGVVPEYGFGLITPVWIATASSCFFQNSKSRQIEPIVSMGRGFREYSLKVLADWKLSSANPKLPEWMFDFADGKQYREEKSQLISENLAEPFDHPHTNLIYSVLSWTNLGDLHVPLEWKVVQYQPNFATGVVEPKIIDAGHTASLRKGTARSSFQIAAPEYTRVVDRTLRAQGVPVREYAYITTNGDLLSALEITKWQGFVPILAEGRKEFPLPKRRSFTPVTVLVLLCVSTVIFVWCRRRRA